MAGVKVRVGSGIRHQYTNDRRGRSAAYTSGNMAAKIHPTSTITGEVDLADDVEIGPQCTLVGPIKIGSGTVLAGHTFLMGPLTIGRENRIYPFACIGFEPQDFKFDPDAVCAGTVIGDRNLIREHVTIHRSTSAKKPTRIGDDCMLMVEAHVGHDCQIGHHCVLVNNTALGGHVVLEDQVTIGGGSGVAQNLRVGRLAFVGGTIGITQHLPSFMFARKRNRVGGVNLIGMRRAGVPRREIDQVRQAFRVIFDEYNTRDTLIEKLRVMGSASPCVGEIYDYFQKIQGPICKRERSEVGDTWIET